jgi:hypothetical protein
MRLGEVETEGSKAEEKFKASIINNKFFTIKLTTMAKKNEKIKIDEEELESFIRLFRNLDIVNELIKKPRDTPGVAEALKLEEAEATCRVTELRSVGIVKSSYKEVGGQIKIIHEINYKGLGDLISSIDSYLEPLRTRYI